MPDKRYRVENFMSKRGITISADTTYREAVELMIKEETNGAVVTDEKNNVVGIISSWDLIKHVVPDYLEDENHLASFETAIEFVNRVKDVVNDKVKIFMTRKVHTAKITDTIMEAAAMLAEHGIRQLPVVDMEGKLVGYINRTDIKLAIGDVINKFVD